MQKPSSLNELTPIIFNMGLTHLGSQASILVIQPMYKNINRILRCFRLKMKSLLTSKGWNTIFPYSFIQQLLRSLFPAIPQIKDFHIVSQTNDMESCKAEGYNHQKLLKGESYKKQLLKRLNSFNGYITLSCRSSYSLTNKVKKWAVK